MKKLLRYAVVFIASLLMLFVVVVFGLVLMVPTIIVGFLTDVYFELVGIHDRIVKLLFKYRGRE